MGYLEWMHVAEDYEWLRGMNLYVWYMTLKMGLGFKICWITGSSSAFCFAACEISCFVIAFQSTEVDDDSWPSHILTVGISTDDAVEFVTPGGITHWVDFWQYFLWHTPGYNLGTNVHDVSQIPQMTTEVSHHLKASHCYETKFTMNISFLEHKMIYLKDFQQPEDVCGSDLCFCFHQP